MPTYRIPARLDYSQPGGPGVNIFHVRTLDDDPSTDLSEALDALEAFYGRVAAWMPAGTKVTLGEGMIADPLGSPEYVRDDVRVITPTGTPKSPSPALLSIVCAWRTQSATRSGRGRTFLGPMSTAAIDADGSIAANCLSDVRVGAQALVADSLSANGWGLGILSVKQGLLRDVTGVTVRDRFAFLSSRRD